MPVTRSQSKSTGEALSLGLGVGARRVGGARVSRTSRGPSVASRMILEFYELVESYITLTVLVSHLQDKARLYGVGLPAKLNRAVMDNLKRMAIKDIVLYECENSLAEPIVIIRPWTETKLRNVSPARLSVNSTEEYVRACATINDIYPSLCRVTPSDKRAAHARGRNVYTKLPSPPSTSILGAQPEHMQLMDVDPLGPSTASSASPMEVQPPPIQRKLTEMSYTTPLRPRRISPAAAYPTPDSADRPVRTHSRGLLQQGSIQLPSPAATPGPSGAIFDSDDELEVSSMLAPDPAKLLFQEELRQKDEVIQLRDETIADQNQCISHQLINLTAHVERIAGKDKEIGRQRGLVNQLNGDVVVERTRNAQLMDQQEEMGKQLEKAEAAKGFWKASYNTLWEATAPVMALSSFLSKGKADGSRA